MRTRWDIVAVAFAAGYMVGMQVGKVPPALPLLEAELDLTRVIAGLIASSFYGIGAVLGVAGGLLVDRLGIRRMVVVGGATMALASVAGGFAESGAPLLAARIVEGFGFVALTVVGPKMLVSAADAGVRRFLLGVWGTYMPVGIALSLVIATALLEQIGWRGLWFLNAGLILLFVLVLRLGCGAGALACAGGDWRRVRRRRRARAAGAAGALVVRRELRDFRRRVAGVDGMAADLPDRDARPLARRGRALHRALRPRHRLRLGSLRQTFAAGRRAVAAAGDHLRRHGG